MFHLVVYAGTFSFLQKCDGALESALRHGPQGGFWNNLQAPRRHCGHGHIRHHSWHFRLGLLKQNFRYHHLKDPPQVNDLLYNNCNQGESTFNVLYSFFQVLYSCT